MSEAPPDPPRGARSLLWLHDDVPRPLDFLSLLAMSDAFFGRIFQVIGRIPPFGTVSMTTHFHASAEELAAHGTAPLAAVADARVFHRSFCDQARRALRPRRPVAGDVAAGRLLPLLGDGAARLTHSVCAARLCGFVP